MQEPKAGNFLLSEPFMPDTNFKRSVVLLCDHKDKGSVGFVINKPLNLKLNDVLDNFPEFNAGLYFGGPVQTDTLHFIHNLGDKISDSVCIGDGLYWGGNFEAIRLLIETKQASPFSFRFFLGYAGWGPGQLKDELGENAWIMAPANPGYIFKVRPDELWRNVLKEMGGQYRIMANFPESPQLN